MRYLHTKQHVKPHIHCFLLVSFDNYGQILVQTSQFKIFLQFGPRVQDRRTPLKKVWNLSHLPIKVIYISVNGIIKIDMKLSNIILHCYVYRVAYHFLKHHFLILSARPVVKVAYNYIWTATPSFETCPSPLNLNVFLDSV